MTGLSALSVRRKRAVECFSAAAACIGTLEAGMALFAITRGQFSMIDAVLACLEQTGPARISLWTWTVAEYEVECLARLRMDGRITDGTLIIDYGARNKNASIIREWKDRFGQMAVRYVVNHAKIATIDGGGWRLLLLGSMNLNCNLRFEQLDVTEGGEDFELVKRIEADLPVLEEEEITGEKVYAVSRLGNAVQADNLPIFCGARVWAK